MNPMSQPEWFAQVVVVRWANTKLRTALKLDITPAVIAPSAK